MSVFVQYKAKCQKCGKEFKTFGLMEEFTFIKKYQAFELCRKCSKELGKLAGKWLKNKKS